MLSNLIIAATLLANAGAVLNFKLSKRKEEEGFDIDNSSASTDQVKNILSSLQSLRIFIAVWNVFVCFLMVTLFGSWIDTPKFPISHCNARWVQLSTLSVMTVIIIAYESALARKTSDLDEFQVYLLAAIRCRYLIMITDQLFNCLTSGIMIEMWFFTSDLNF